MIHPQNITPMLAPLASLQRLLARFDDQGIVIGGVAASLLGKPRLTADVDAMFLLSTEELPILMEAAAQEGLVPQQQSCRPERGPGRHRPQHRTTNGTRINTDHTDVHR